MRFLVDSDVLIAFLNAGQEPTTLDGVIGFDDVALGVVTYMEVWEGFLRRPDAVTPRERFDRVVATTPILPFTPEIARRCAHLRDDLRRRGRPVRPRYLDLINAATALEHGLALITHNAEDYADVPGLRLR